MTAQLQKVGSDRESFEVRNPATGEAVGSFPVHTVEDIAERVASGRVAQQWWAAQGFAGRKRQMHAWVRWLARDCDTLYDLGFRETGKPKPDVQFELLAGLEDVRWSAAHAKRVLGERRVAPGLAMMNFAARVSYEPLGVVGVITPWNAPIYTALCGLAYGLAAGNAVILKPSEISAATGVYAAESFYRANPDAPEGLVSWVTGFGETGAALCRSGIDKLGFTGSVPTGRRVMAACAENLTPVLLELGGKDATVVAADADIESAAAAVVWGAMWNSGQACVGVERVYVVEHVRDEFLGSVKEKAEQVSVGMEPMSDIGPMTLPNQIEIVRRHVTDAFEHGGSALVGGLESIRPPFVHPIVLVDVPEESAVVQEETFGPVVVINTVKDEDEAIARANATRYGLGSSVFAKSQGRQIAHRLRAGGTTINSVLTFVGMPSLPFGGVGDSGFGRFHGDDGLREFTRAKATTRKRFQLGQDMQRFPRGKDDFDVVRKVVRLRYGRKFR
ncbi:MAG TPA: aldehyde dehydrogenase family protein [Jatrophihabitans sp.]|nr:aldehyde dehydrogenase family protein [Jatrophihabitans sp.]